MSILGHYNNFFFAAHLLDIAMGVKTLRTILSSVTHNGKQVCVPTQKSMNGFKKKKKKAHLALMRPVPAADDDGGPAGCGGVPVHGGGLQLLPQVLQQERGWGRTGHEVRRHDDC